VHETAGISTRRVSMQVLPFRLLEEWCENNSCIPTICSVCSPCRYKVTMS
jgi:hypothetical protein